MINAVLIREGIGRGRLKNIGDFTQSIAQRQYWKQVDRLIEIEELSDVDSSEPVNVIMNGWFMWHPEKFPPSESVNPLFVSFHITPQIEKAFFTDKTIQYLKKHEPIGARDTKTQQMLEAHGIRSYFSGCLTLTLGKTYMNNNRDGKVYIVDPIVCFSYKNSKIETLLSIIKAGFWFLTHLKKVRKLSSKYLCCNKTFLSKISRKIDGLMEVSLFHKQYSKCFAEDILFNAEYISQIVDNKASIDEKFKMADERLRKYSKASLVITRRIHAALPCLSMKTPVILTISDDIISNVPKKAADGGRFGGLLELFNYKRFCPGVIESKGCDDFITFNNIPQNPDGYLYYQELLDKKVMEFVKSVEK